MEELSSILYISEECFKFWHLILGETKKNMNETAVKPKLSSRTQQAHSIASAGGVSMSHFASLGRLLVPVQKGLKRRPPWVESQRSMAKDSPDMRETRVFLQKP